MGNILNITDEEIKALTNLSAFNTNFGDVRIEHYRKGEPYYIWFPINYDDERYIQRCPSLDYLNGWLYGAVQCKCRFPKNENI